MLRSLGCRSLTTTLPMLISPRCDRLEPGDHAQQRRLAAAGGPEQHDEFAIGDGEVDAVKHLELAVGLAHIADGDRCHGYNIFCAASRRLALADNIRLRDFDKASPPRLLAMKAGVADMLPAKSRTLATPQA